MSELASEEFAAFFEAVHGVAPFPWQQRLLEELDRTGRWPRALALPTGAGKTSAIDIGVFALALDLQRARSGSRRRMPTRLAFVVDRRLIVDAAYDRAALLQAALKASDYSIVSRVARELSRVAEPGFAPLHVARLRGGAPRERDWTPSPAHPTVLLSTVDQVGSRLLFRGYGVSPRMRSIHAGLLGEDTAILLDEVHLSEPFRQTLERIERYRGNAARPWTFVELSATPRSQVCDRFELTDDDRAHPVLAARLDAPKPTVLSASSATNDHYADTFVEHALRLSTLGDGEARRVLVVVNRVARARAIFDRLDARLKRLGDVTQGATSALLIGRARPVETDEVRKDVLARTAVRPYSEKTDGLVEAPFFLVATQTVEAGADLDFDALVTELAPLDALRQRFGRVDRVGRLAASGRVAHGVVVGHADAAAKGASDPIYGGTLPTVWRWLSEIAKREKHIDFGFAAMQQRVQSCDVAVAEELQSPRIDAPVLLRSYVDLLQNTHRTPMPDLPVDMFLHGVARGPSDVQVVWRADVPRPNDTSGSTDVASLLDAMPPRVDEAISLPLWLVRRWLTTPRGATFTPDVSDVDADANDPESLDGDHTPVAWRWQGGDDGVRAVMPGEIRPGDMLVVPVRRGGCDAYGWNAGYNGRVTDVAHLAAANYAASTYAVRIHRELLRNELEAIDGAQVPWFEIDRRWHRFAETAADETGVRELIDAIERSGAFPDDPGHPGTLDALRRLSDIKQVRRLTVLRPYRDAEALIILAPRGLAEEHRHDLEASTEDDERATTGFGTYAPDEGPVPESMTLRGHGADVERHARAIAESIDLGQQLTNDVALAGRFHDVGKGDRRFQRYLMGTRWNYSDYDETEPLAKSLRTRSRIEDRLARAAAELPDGWRHEVLSVRLAIERPEFEAAYDPELVVWLIGTHHGWGRPGFEMYDELDGQPSRVRLGGDDVANLRASHAPHAAEFAFPIVDEDGLLEVSWAKLFARVRERYGAWGLAHLETVLRLADHRASANASSPTILQVAK